MTTPTDSTPTQATNGKTGDTPPGGGVVAIDYDKTNASARSKEELAEKIQAAGQLIQPILDTARAESAQHTRTGEPTPQDREWLTKFENALGVVAECLKQLADNTGADSSALDTAARRLRGADEDGAASIRGVDTVTL